MGLEDFKESDEFEEGTVKTRKNIENVSLNKDTWDHLIVHSPQWLTTFAGMSSWSENEVKSAVQRIDELLERGSTTNVTISESEKENMRKARSDLVDNHLR